jgi:hypothetical protein
LRIDGNDRRSVPRHGDQSSRGRISCTTREREVAQAAVLEIAVDDFDEAQ